jgi:hypothetical protein
VKNSIADIFLWEKNAIVPPDRVQVAFIDRFIDLFVTFLEKFIFRLQKSFENKKTIK